MLTFYAVVAMVMRFILIAVSAIALAYGIVRLRDASDRKLAMVIVAISAVIFLIEMFIPIRVINFILGVVTIVGFIWMIIEIHRA